MSSSRETWTNDEAQLVVVDYDAQGVAEVSREALHQLLTAAGFAQVDEPA